MSRLFIMLMIVLLPLRGWAGDLMSVQMAASGLASHAADAMPADCPMQARAVAAHAGSAQAPAGLESCTSCDLCLPMAEAACFQPDILTFGAHPEPLTAGIDFVSATPTPTLKPPIS